jgi:hypothetical protein
VFIDHTACIVCNRVFDHCLACVSITVYLLRVRAMLAGTLTCRFLCMSRFEFPLVRVRLIAVRKSNVTTLTS